MSCWRQQEEAKGNGESEAKVEEDVTIDGVWVMMTRQIQGVCIHIGRIRGR